MVLLMLYQALAQLGIYLQKRAQLVQLDQLDQLALLEPQAQSLDLRERLAPQALLDQLAHKEFKVLLVLQARRAQRGQRQQLLDRQVHKARLVRQGQLEYKAQLERQVHKESLEPQVVQVLKVLRAQLDHKAKRDLRVSQGLQVH
jgi:hypothetical protein